MINFFSKMGIQMGGKEDRRFGSRCSPDNTDGIPIPVGGTFIHLEFRQAIQKNIYASGFFERGAGDLADQYDVGNDGFLNGFDCIDKGGQFFENRIHSNQKYTQKSDQVNTSFRANAPSLRCVEIKCVYPDTSLNG